MMRVFLHSRCQENIPTKLYVHILYTRPRVESTAPGGPEIVGRHLLRAKMMLFRVNEDEKNSPDTPR